MLLTILGNIFAGGATGLLGVIFQRFSDYQNKKLDLQLEKQRMDNELEKRKIDILIADKEWAGRLSVARAEGEASMQVAETNAFSHSLWQEPDRYSTATKLTSNQQWLMVILDALRGVVRPFLTIYLCALTTYVWFQVKMLMGTTHIEEEAALEVWKMVVGQILYLTTTVVLWWFGTRNKSEVSKIK